MFFVCVFFCDLVSLGKVASATANRTAQLKLFKFNIVMFIPGCYCKIDCRTSTAHKEAALMARAMRVFGSGWGKRCSNHYTLSPKGKPNGCFNSGVDAQHAPSLVAFVCNPNRVGDVGHLDAHKMLYDD